MKKKVYVILGSSRPNRKSDVIAQWFLSLAKPTDIDFEIVDLATWKLPLFDEPLPPSMNQYQNDHTKKWAKKIAAADGFILVTPEYNHGIPAILKNALDYLKAEWDAKPVGFIAYGWASGKHVIEHLRQVVTILGMNPLEDAVTIRLAQEIMDEQGNLVEPSASLAAHEPEVARLVASLSTALSS